MDDDIRPWLKSFVESIGYETAKHLLTGAGEFTSLDEARLGKTEGEMRT